MLSRRSRQLPGAPPTSMREDHESPVSLPPLPEPRPRMLRVLEGAVIDFPAPILRADANRWAATLWRDFTKPAGWGRAIWWPSPYHRGYIPVGLDYADIIEFGADIPVKQGRTTRWIPVRWYGIVIERAKQHLILHGPHPTLPSLRGSPTSFATLSLTIRQRGSVSGKGLQLDDTDINRENGAHNPKVEGRRLKSFLRHLPTKHPSSEAVLDQQR
jgi:hypothetical protein